MGAVFISSIQNYSVTEKIYLLELDKYSLNIIIVSHYLFEKIFFPKKKNIEKNVGANAPSHSSGYPLELPV